MCLRGGLKKNKKKKVKCEHCGVEIDKLNLNRHLKNIHNIDVQEKHINSVHNSQKDHKCEYCQKTFSRLQNLQGHIKRVHHKIKDRKCGTCGKMFSQLRALQKHVKDVHLGLRKCTCNICGREYSKPDSLRMHIKHVHDKIRYVIVFLNTDIDLDLIRILFFVKSISRKNYSMHMAS